MPLNCGVGESEVSLSPPTLWDPMDCSLPGSSVHGIFPARVLEWIAVSFSRGIFLTQGLNLGLLRCRRTLYPLSHQGSPKTPENPLDSKKIKSVNLKGNQPWIFVGRTEDEAPVFWSSYANSWLIGKVPDAGKDWGLKEKRASEDDKAGQHHSCNGHELGQTSGDGEGQGGLVCCSPWGHKELDTNGRLNNKNIPLRRTIISWWN